jgi:hypothetical protein
MNELEKTKKIVNSLLFEVEEFALNSRCCPRQYRYGLGCCNCMDLFRFLTSRKNPEKIAAKFAICSLFDQVSYEYFGGNYYGPLYSYRSGWYRFVYDNFKFPKLYQHNSQGMGHPLIFFKIAENRAFLDMRNFSYVNFWQHYSELFNLFTKGMKIFIEEDFSKFYLMRKVVMHKKIKDVDSLQRFNFDDQEYIQSLADSLPIDHQYDSLVEWNSFKSFLMSDIEKEFPITYFKKIKRINDSNRDKITRDDIVLRNLEVYS